MQDSRKYLLATAPAFRGYDLGFEESDNAPEETDPRLNRSGANNPRGERRDHRPRRREPVRRAHHGYSVDERRRHRRDVQPDPRRAVGALTAVGQLEEPLGEKQIDCHENSDQWVSRRDVLRCIIDDGGPDGEVTIHIDDKELSLAEFGRMLTVHAGWGMRIAFVPEEFISENPKIEIRKPKRRKR